MGCMVWGVWYGVYGMGCMWCVYVCVYGVYGVYGMGCMCVCRCVGVWGVWYGVYAVCMIVYGCVWFGTALCPPPLLPVGILV
jgi:hypothetical protein